VPATFDDFDREYREGQEQAKPRANRTGGSESNRSADRRDPKPKRRHFTLTTFAAVKLGTELQYLVKDLIPRAGLTVIWGPPKCGKSFWMFDTAMHITLGLPYRGRRVRQGTVVYLALEGGHGFRARIEAFRQRHRVTEAPFFLITGIADLVADHAGLVEDIRKELGSNNPALVVIDTLNRSLVGSENKPEDMAAYVRAADAIREAFNCAVAVIHHCGVDGTRPRGHTSLTGAADAQLATRRDAAGNIVVTVEAMKDGPEGEVIFSKLEVVEVGTDKDGEVITSCIVLPVEGGAVRPATARKLSDRQRLALDFLANCAAERGKPPPAEFGLPAGLLAVAVNEWRDELYSRGVLDREATNPREDFRRLKNQFAARSLVSERNGIVWSIPS
jgi:hypothetical protein